MNKHYIVDTRCINKECDYYNEIMRSNGCYAHYVVFDGCNDKIRKTNILYYCSNKMCLDEYGNECFIKGDCEEYYFYKIELIYE